MSYLGGGYECEPLQPGARTHAPRRPLPAVARKLIGLGYARGPPRRWAKPAAPRPRSHSRRHRPPPPPPHRRRPSLKKLFGF